MGILFRVGDIVTCDGGNPCHPLLILFQRVVSQIDTQHFFFHSQLNVPREWPDIRQLAANGFRIHGFRCSLEKRHLTLYIFLGCVLCRLY